jgi:hypothetical protein
VGPRRLGLLLRVLWLPHSKQVSGSPLPTATWEDECMSFVVCVCVNVEGLVLALLLSR